MNQEQNEEPQTPERSKVTSAQISMHRFEGLINLAAQASLSDNLDGVTERVRSLSLAQLELLKWSIISQDEKKELFRLKDALDNNEDVM